MDVDKVVLRTNCNGVIAVALLILFSTITSQKKFYTSIKEQVIKDELIKLTNKAFQKEVFGAPTFIVNNKIFWGQDRLEYALEELKES